MIEGNFSSVLSFLMYNKRFSVTDQLYFYSLKIHESCCKNKNKEIKQRSQQQRAQLSAHERSVGVAVDPVSSLTTSVLDDLIFSSPEDFSSSSQASRCPLYYHHHPLLQNKHHCF